MKHPSTARELYPTEYRTKALTPRVKLAVRLYYSGLAKTKREAAAMAGLDDITFYATSTTDPQTMSLAAQVEREVADETISTAKLIQQLGRKALGKIAQVMDHAGAPVAIQLKAAQDLADRSPETSKVINVNARVETPLSEDQIAALRRGMIEAAALREKFPAAATGSYITVDDKSTARSLDLVKERAPLALPPGGVDGG